MIGKEKEFFLENLSLLLGSGMPISQALRAMQRAVKSRQLFKIVERLVEDVDNGQSFWQAFGKTKLFPAYVISLIRIGEESGRLSENLKLLSRQQTKDRVLKDRIHSAMIYPSIVLSLTLTLGIAIAWFILPRLASVFTSLRLKIPFLTRMLIGFGSLLQKWGFIAVPLFLAILILLYWVLFVNSKSKFIGEKILFALPGVGELLREVEISRFGYVMGNLLGAGVSMVHSMDLLSQASSFDKYSKLYIYLKSGIEEGLSFSGSFAKFPKLDKLLPVPVQQMVVAGEESGKLEQIFISVGENFEQKSEMTAQNLTVILEPILLLVVWVGVGGLALAVIVPLYSLVGSLNDSAGGTTNTSSSRPAIIKTVLPTAASTSTSASVSTTTPSGVVPQVRGVSIVASNVNITVASGQQFLYVRQQPDPKSKIVGKIIAGQTYSSPQHQNNWYEVTASNGKDAWVNGDYVTVDN